MTEPTYFTSDTLTFLSDLKANNEREWFAANKKTYELVLKEPAKRFANDMAKAVSELTGQQHGSKIYRINRDIRFSKDKTPYNTHVHLSFVAEQGDANTPMWFFGLNTEKLSLGCGVFQFDKNGLDAFRTQMDGARGQELLDLSNGLKAIGVRIGEPELKRVPPGFDKEHVHAEALRRKGFSSWIDLDDTRFVTEPNLVENTVSNIKKLLPVHRFLADLR